jgi:hypothetical protein
MKAEAKGQIGTAKNMLPVEKNGFRSFRMWADDETKAMVVREDGSKYRPREIVQVVLPNDERGQKLFNSLWGGRKVLVKGRLTSRPNSAKNAKGELVSYANPVIYLDTLEFLDENPESVGRRVIEVLRERGTINDELANTLTQSFKTHLASLHVSVEDQSQHDADPVDTNDLGLV